MPLRHHSYMKQLIGAVAVWYFVFYSGASGSGFATQVGPFATVKACESFGTTLGVATEAAGDVVGDCFSSQSTPQENWNFLIYGRVGMTQIGPFVSQADCDTQRSEPVRLPNLYALSACFNSG